MRQRDSNLFMGRKWNYISVGEMVCFFGVMLRMILEPMNMGGYVSYFQKSPIITVGPGYSIRLRGYEPWGRSIMTLTRFKKPIS